MKTETLAANLPKLDKPGAGLPPIELLAARRLFSWKRKRSNRTETVGVFESEREKMLELLNRCEPELRGNPVLIKRLRGLEDSSRFWSLYMVLDHLRIVNGRVTGVIASLAAGKVPPGETSTADVKPTEVGEEVVESFRAACDQFLETAGKIEDLSTSEKYPHPWFGPLNAEGWHFMVAFHMGLHRKQMEAILAGLSC